MNWWVVHYQYYSSWINLRSIINNFIKSSIKLLNLFLELREERSQCCMYNIPPPQVRGYINLKILASFSQKYTPLPHVIIFVKMGFLNCSTNEYMNELVVILKWINFKNGKLKIEIMKIFKFNGYKNNFSHS